MVHVSFSGLSLSIIKNDKDNNNITLLFTRSSNTQDENNNTCTVYTRSGLRVRLEYENNFIM